MHITEHARHRMAERGIPKRLVAFARRHGRWEGDRCVLDRKETQQLLDELADEMRLAKKVLDKGGVVVVEAGDSVITTFNVDQRVPRRSRG
jgi:hypothetical protein